ETIKRRLSEKNVKLWGLPDIILIDGGKGQLDAALKARDELGRQNLIFIGLAKREEEIIIHKQKSNIVVDQKILQKLRGFSNETEDFIALSVPHSTHMIKLLQRIRDESHRFAVSYHSTLKQNRQTKSILDDIPGIGALTKKKLLRKFGSVKGISMATEDELNEVVNSKIAKQLKVLTGQKN
ncbi:MAG: helix-hairpin-helix domain-containing protein, partial [Bdellovibrionales bacterium]